MRLLPALDYPLALLRLTLAATLARPWTALASALAMFANNLILFLIWVIYFANFSNLRGWVLADLALLLGVVAWAFGLVWFFAGGVRELAETIVDGRLDIHLGRPRHPLPGLLMGRSIPSGLGDMASAFVFWLWLGDSGSGELPLLLLVATAAAVVLGATVTISQCLVFWRPRALPLCEDLLNMLMMVVFYPQHAYGFFVRLVLFSLVPTAFIALLPVEAVRQQDPGLVLAVLAAAVVYAALAAFVFDRGLSRYASGNRLLELR